MEGNKISLRSGSQFGALSAGNLKTASAISGTLQTVTDQAGNNSALAISSAFIRATGSGVSSGGGLVLGSLASGYGAIWSSAIATPSITNYGLTLSSGETNLNTTGSIDFKISNVSNAQIDSSGFSIGSGTLTKNGALTIKGAGSNILSLRNSANVEVAYLTNTSFFAAQIIGVGLGNINILAPANGVLNLTNASGTSFDRMTLGGTTVNEPAIKKNGSGISIRTGTDSALASFSSSDYTSGNLSSGTLATARPVKFGDRGTITEAGFVALGLDRQIAIEHNSVIYYIPVSQTIIP